MAVVRTGRVPESNPRRAGWHKPDEVVKEVATQDPTAAAKVPEFLRTARDLSSEEWDKIIKQAKRMTDKKEGTP